MPISLSQARAELYVAVVSDALDALGRSRQVLDVELRPMTGQGLLIGRARTTLWGDMYHVDPRPYELELQAVDACQPDEVLVCAAAGSMHSGIWGELLSTAAKNRGCAGALVDGAVRDVTKMTSMGFNVFARGVNPRDSQNRQRVVDLNVPVEIGGVRIEPGDLIVADVDGVVVVPQRLEAETLERAWNKVHAENITRDAIRGGMLAVEAYRKFGVL